MKEPAVGFMQATYLQAAVRPSDTATGAAQQSQQWTLQQLPIAVTALGTGAGCH